MAELTSITDSSYVVPSRNTAYVAKSSASALSHSRTTAPSRMVPTERSHAAHDQRRKRLRNQEANKFTSTQIKPFINPLTKYRDLLEFVEKETVTAMTTYRGPIVDLTESEKEDGSQSGPLHLSTSMPSAQREISRSLSCAKQPQATDQESIATSTQQHPGSGQARYLACNDTSPTSTTRAPQSQSKAEISQPDLERAVQLLQTFRPVYDSQQQAQMSLNKTLVAQVQALESRLAEQERLTVRQGKRIDEYDEWRRLMDSRGLGGRLRRENWNES